LKTVCLIMKKQKQIFTEKNWSTIAKCTHGDFW
jgi:hypothetical protein